MNFEKLKSDIQRALSQHKRTIVHQAQPLLSTWINFNPDMNKKSSDKKGVEWN